MPSPPSERSSASAAPPASKPVPSSVTSTAIRSGRSSVHDLDGALAVRGTHAAPSSSRPRSARASGRRASRPRGRSCESPVRREAAEGDVLGLRRDGQPDRGLRRSLVRPPSLHNSPASGLNLRTTNLCGFTLQVTAAGRLRPDGPCAELTDRISRSVPADDREDCPRPGFSSLVTIRGRGRPRCAPAPVDPDDTSPPVRSSSPLKLSRSFRRGGRPRPGCPASTPAISAPRLTGTPSFARAPASEIVGVIPT